LKVLVTGGSEGIGRAIAAEAVKAGADVEIWARREDKLAEALKDLGAGTSRAVDIGDAIAVRAAAGRYIATNGAPDRLFQCAGFAIAAFVDQVRDEDIERLLKVNVAGAMHVVRAFAPVMSKRGAGAIVLTASDLGFVGLFGWSVYAATKHAVVGFASSLRNELKPFGVSVQTLCPPATQTPGFDRENATKPRSVHKAEEAGGVMSAEAVARAAWVRCGRGGLYIIPNRTSRILFALSRVSTDLAQSFVRAPGPGKPR
jgi:3-dehydrosphinganine reductase